MRSPHPNAVLGQSELRLHDVIDALPAAIYMTDAEGRITHFNEAAVKLCGRVPQLGSDRWCVTWKLYYPDGRPMPHDECPMAIALKEGRPVHGTELIVERPDGERVWCAPYPMPLFDAGGRVIGGVNMLFDLTDRKLAEDARAKLGAIVEFSEDAIISKDLNGVITSWNRGAERLFGYTASEATGQLVTMIFPPDRLDEEPRILERIRRGEAIEHYETVRRSKDGRLLDISLTVSPVRDERGHIVGISKIARDITQRKREEQMLREKENDQRRGLEKALQTEREIAESFQRSLLPDRLPDLEGIHISAHYISASLDVTVGGDFYDAFILPNGRIGLAIGDVAGHGVQAASVMGQVRMLLRAYASEGHPPAMVIDLLSRVLKSGEMVTVLYFVLDPISGKATYANAGHTPPLIVPPEGPSRFIVGVDPPLAGGWYEYRNFDTMIAPHETVVLYTDGLIESEKSIDVGLKRLAEVSERAARADPDGIASTIIKSLAEGVTRRDDVALLAFRRQPLNLERLRIILPATPDSLSALRISLRRWLEACDVPPQEFFDILVACGEAGTNVIEHAYGPNGGSFEVEARRDHDRFLVSIRDQGSWQTRQTGKGGRGLLIMRQLMDSVDVFQDPGGTTVRLERRLRPAAVL